MSPSSSTPPDPIHLFDRRLHAMRRQRAAAGFGAFSFLKDAAVEDIALRLAEINREFPRVLDLGAHDGRFARTVTMDPLLSARIGEVVASDLAAQFLKAPLSVAASEEALPFRDHSFDLVVSALSLHWVNDLPGTLVQVRRILKPDGLFIGLLLGGRTLAELRQALIEAESDVRGGASPRVSPFLDLIDGAALLQRAGLAMPVSDSETRKVRYADPLRLLRDLRGMGETAAFADRSGRALTRTILLRAVEIYVARFSDPDGRVRATFDFIALSGWAPAPGQPVPKRPGSATVRLSDALGVPEQKA